MLDGDMIDRIRGCLWGVLIADALSMPVHWYYNPADIQKQFGRIVKYEAPQAAHPSSIMAVSNTGGHGRGGQAGKIIGDVINHGKHQFWGKRGTHYHQGMQAGENTLNALCMRVVMRSISANAGAYDLNKWLADYVAFMTTPGSHNDTYAESFHRDFFANWSRGVPPAQCSRGTEGHNTASVGGFVMLPPVIASAVAKGSSPEDAALQHQRSTHESSKLEGFTKAYTRVLAGLLKGQDMEAAAAAAPVPRDVNPKDDDMVAVYRKFGPACYIDSAFPVVLHMALKYSDNFEEGVLANTNAGGENCHRGAAIGALLGAAAGEKKIPEHLKAKLHAHDDIKREIDAFVSAL